MLRNENSPLKSTFQYSTILLFPGPDLVYEVSGLMLWSRPGTHASRDHSMPSHQGRPCARQKHRASKNIPNFSQLYNFRDV